jgi:hypothetical protein
MRIRSLAAAGIATALLATLSACNNDSASKADDTTQETTSSAPADDSDAQAEALSAAAFKKAVERAQSQQEGRSGHMEATFDLTVAGQSATMNMSSDFATGDDPEDALLNAKIDAAGVQMEMRLVDEVLYIKSPGMSMSPGKPWVAADTNDPNNPLGSMADSAKPQSFTKFLADADNVKDLGTETVDGIETTHYELTVSTKKLMAGNKELSSLAPQATGMPKQLKINVWLNDDELPIQMKVPFGKMGTFEMHFSDYGKDVDVQAPPANQVSQMGAASL